MLFHRRNQYISSFQEIKRKNLEPINLSKKEYSLAAYLRLLLFPKDKSFSCGKVSSGIFLKASLTVESAFVLPLFFLCTCTLISFMNIYGLQTRKLWELCQEAKEMGMYAYVTDSSEDLEIPSVYTYKIPVSILPLPDLVMTNWVRVHPWTGYSAKEGEEKSAEMVYITENGSVYHTRSNCSYLDLSIRQVAGSQVAALRNKGGGKYYGCEYCVKENSQADVVYLTDYGNRYHNLSTCSGLKRTVRLVKKEEVEGMRLCSRCAGS